jgi:5,10-methylenetetrahydromethanopterin reductase
VAAPFRTGVMQLTMEPLAENLSHARSLDSQGFDTIWLAEAYPWWRKHHYAMPVRDYRALSAANAELVRFDEEFARARAR